MVMTSADESIMRNRVAPQMGAWSHKGQRASYLQCFAETPSRDTSLALAHQTGGYWRGEFIRGEIYSLKANAIKQTQQSVLLHPPCPVTAFLSSSTPPPMPGLRGRAQGPLRSVRDFE
jgi:hypothetical protein